MAMIGLGPMEILLLIALAGGGQAADTMTFVDPQAYFKARNVEISILRMVELAGKEAADSKGQIQQLAALKYLAQQAAELKKDGQYASHRQAIEQIAKGQKAQDRLGFAKEYAQRVLHQLDGTKAPQESLPPPTQGLEWFPPACKIAAVLDNRGYPPTPGLQANLGLFMRMMPGNDRERFFEVVETLGNIRIDRVTVGAAEKDQNYTLYLRFTGRARHDWLIAIFKNFNDLKVDLKESKDAQQTTITQILPREGNQEGGGALIGDTDLVLAFSLQRNKAPADLLAQVLELRSKKGENAATGPLKKYFEKISPKSTTHVVAEIPEALTKAEMPLPGFAVPHWLVGQMLGNQAGYDLDVEAGFSNAEKAREMVQFITKTRMDGLAALKAMAQNPPAGVPVEIPFAAFEKVVESIQVQAEGNNARFKMLITNEYLAAVSRMMSNMAEKELGPPQ